MDGIDQILRTTRRMATIGMSRDAHKFAHAIPAFLVDRGFVVVPVNPFADQIAGLRAYARLEDVPGAIDLVQVFRPAAEAAACARSAVAVGARTLWLQAGIRSDEAGRIAEEAGIVYVENDCLGTQVARRDFTVPVGDGGNGTGAST